MARIEKAAPEKAQGELEKLYAGIKGSFGRIPNIFQYMGNSPALLKGLLELTALSGKTSLSPELREKIALAIGSSNHCNYCIAAHTAVAKGLGVAQGEIEGAKGGNASDKKTAAILKFAKTVVEKRGDITDDDFKALRAEHVSDQEVCEILLVVTINMLTNTFNHVVQTPVDF